MDSNADLVISGVLAQSPAQFESLWAIREGIPEAVGKAGKAYKYDVSIPVSKFKEIVNKTKEHLRSKGLLHEDAVRDVVGYGHFGDGADIFPLQNPGVLTRHVGNLHINIAAAAYTPEISAALEPFVFELVGECCRMNHKDSG